MKSLITRQFKVRLAVTASVCSLLAVQTASAQFVPRNVTIIAAPGTNFGGADTARSAELRSMGQYHEGQGAHLQGMGRLLEGAGQYEKDHQTATSMAIENKSLVRETRRFEKQQREQDEQTRLANARSSNETKTLVRLRDNPAEQNIVSGQTLNFLWERLGTRVELLAQRGALKDLDLTMVRFQTVRGASPETLSETIDENGKVLWPSVLQIPELADIRRNISYSISKAHQAAKVGQSATVHYQAALQLVPSLQRTACSRTARDGIAAWKVAKQFCESLRRTLALASTGECDRVQSLLTYRPKNTADLVRHMRLNNLRFAPSAEGTGTTYQRIHQALVELDPSVRGGAQLAGR